MIEPRLAEAVLVALGLGVGTLAFRLACVELRGRWSPPASVESALAWVPVAALGAMVVPFLLNGESGRVEISTLSGALMTVIVASRTRNLLLSVVSGWTTFWIAARLLG